MGSLFECHVNLLQNTTKGSWLPLLWRSKNKKAKTNIITVNNCIQGTEVSYTGAAGHINPGNDIAEVQTQYSV